jgi:hypothetical protein
VVLARRAAGGRAGRPGSEAGVSHTRLPGADRRPAARGPRPHRNLFDRQYGGSGIVNEGNARCFEPKRRDETGARAWRRASPFFPNRVSWLSCALSARVRRGATPASRARPGTAAACALRR